MIRSNTVVHAVGQQIFLGIITPPVHGTRFQVDEIAIDQSNGQDAAFFDKTVRFFGIGSGKSEFQGQKTITSIQTAQVTFATQVFFVFEEKAQFIVGETEEVLGIQFFAQPPIAGVFAIELKFALNLFFQTIIRIGFDKILIIWRSWVDGGKKVSRKGIGFGEVDLVLAACFGGFKHFQNIAFLRQLVGLSQFLLGNQGLVFGLYFRFAGCTEADIEAAQVFTFRSFARGGCREVLFQFQALFGSFDCPFLSDISSFASQLRPTGSDFEGILFGDEHRIVKWSYGSFVYRIVAATTAFFLVEIFPGTVRVNNNLFALSILANDLCRQVGTGKTDRDEE